MTLTLATLALPSGLLWPDEHTAHAVAQSVRRTLDGGQVVFHAGLTGGRAITLQSTADSGWLTRSQVETVAALAATPGAVYSLMLNGQSFPVIFRHHEPPAFEAAPLWPYANPQPGDFYLATLKLMTV